MVTIWVVQSLIRLGIFLLLPLPHYSHYLTPSPFVLPFYQKKRPLTRKPLLLSRKPPMLLLPRGTPMPLLLPRKSPPSPPPRTRAADLAAAAAGKRDANAAAGKKAAGAAAGAAAAAKKEDDAKRNADAAAVKTAAAKDADAAAKKAAAASNGDAAQSSPRPVSKQMTMLITQPYEAQEDDQINLVAGEYIYIVEMGDDGWWSGTTMDRKFGWFPAHCVTATGKLGS